MQAQSELGYLYQKGRYIDKDIDKSIFYFKSAIKNIKIENVQKYNNLISLGELYDDKKTVKDSKTAIKYFKKARKFMPESFKKSDYIYLRWINKKLAYIEQSKFKDNPNAIRIYDHIQDEIYKAEKLGKKYSEYGGNPNIKLSIHWYEKAAKLGSKKSILILAGIYYFGAGDKIPDYDKALYWYKKNKKNTGLHLSIIGNIYLSEGKCDKAVKLYKEAISNKEPYPVQVSLGDLYYKNKNCKQDYQKAMFWYKQAVKEKAILWNYALLYIAKMYEKGLGVLSDKRKASELYKKAIENQLDAKCDYSRVLLQIDNSNASKKIAKKYVQEEYQKTNSEICKDIWEKYNLDTF